MLLEVVTLHRLVQRMDGRVGEDPGGTEIETLDGAVLLEEVLAVTGVESRMALRQHLVAGVEEVLDEEGTGTGIVTTTTGGCPRREEIVTLHLPGVADAEAAAGTVGEAGEGRETRDLVVHPAETLDMIERTVDPYRHTRRGGIMWNIHIM